MSTNNIIGKKYEADYEISFEKIKEFVEVLGDNNPHYIDREFVNLLMEEIHMRHLLLLQFIVNQH